MPVHDWSRVDAGIFHAFHNSWITHFMGALNKGLLPDGYYALSEQHVGLKIPDVITLHTPDLSGITTQPTGNGGVALIDTPPKVGRRLVASADKSYTTLRRTLAVRHSSGHRLVAIVEIVSPRNKDRPASVAELAAKVESAIRNGVHVLLIDMFSPGKHDPSGMHGAAWAFFDTQDVTPPTEQSVCVASYLASQIAEAYVEYLGYGEPLPDMPLFLEYRAHVVAPLEETYMAAYEDMPRFHKAILEAS